MDPQDSPSVSKRPRLDTVNPVPSTSAVTLDSLSAAILVSPSTDVAGIPAAPVGESTIGTVADTKMNHNIPIPVGVVPAEEDVAPDVFDEEAHEEKLKIWDLFAEEYHDVVSELPLEYHRNFRLLEELEESQQASTETMKSTLLKYLHSLKATIPVIVTPSILPLASVPSTSQSKATSPSQRELISKLTKATRQALRSGEDKVGICLGMYESVDRHIVRLDASLASYALDLINNPPSLSQPKKSSKKDRKREGERLREMEGDEEDVFQRERAEKAERIDPNEPTYCICQRVSFGQMIACENDNCLREWFHLECVQLTSPPIGNWLCAECTILLGRDKVELQIASGSASLIPVAQGV